mgnify:FL=1
MDIKKITMEYSVAVINHAIAKAELMNEKQKDIAEYLGINETNINHYKNGKQNLGPTKCNLLIARYGMPRQDSGKYLEATIYESVAEYLSQLPERNNSFYRQGLVQAFSSEGTVKILTNLVGDGVLAKDVSFDLGAGIRITPMLNGCSKQNIPAVLDWIKQRLEQDETKEWFEKMSEFIASSDSIIDWRNAPSIKDYGWDNVVIHKDEHVMLYLLCDFYFNNRTSFGLPAEEVYNSKHIDARPVNLTGKEILHFTSSNTGYVEPQAIRLFKSQLMHGNNGLRHDKSIADITVPDELLALSNLAFKGVICNLTMNKNMEYRIHIQEDRGLREAQVIIRNVPQDKIIDVYKKLASHFKLTEETEFQLKTNIAAAGGYLPGVEVL